MSEWGQRIAVAAAAVAVAFVAVAYALPRQVTVTRSVKIAAPAATVFALVGDLRRYRDWSPWLGRDTKTAVTFTGPLDGVGQTMEWASGKAGVGSGRETISRIQPGKAVEMSLNRAGKAATTSFELRADDGATRLIWAYQTDLGDSPLARYSGLSLDRAVGPDLERGLARVKALAETEPAPGG